jgi:hypothetical protein
VECRGGMSVSGLGLVSDLDISELAETDYESDSDSEGPCEPRLGDKDDALVILQFRLY